MTYEVQRDFRGYGAHPPHPRWPGGARIAVNFVINYEEGSELSFPDGDGVSEWGVSDSNGQAARSGRDLAAESMFEYGSRVGFLAPAAAVRRARPAVDRVRLRAGART